MGAGLESRGAKVPGLAFAVDHAYPEYTSLGGRPGGGGVLRRRAHVAGNAYTVIFEPCTACLELYLADHFFVFLSRQVTHPRGGAWRHRGRQSYSYSRHKWYSRHK